MGRNKIAEAVIGVAFSAFIGFMFVFVVVSAVNIAWPSEARWEEVNGVNIAVAVVALVISSIAMFSSLRVPSKYTVLGNGLLLGGVFTTIYSVTQASSYNSPPVPQFLVTVAALAITVVVGWMKFTKKPEEVQVAHVSNDEVRERLFRVERVLSNMKETLKEV